MKHAGISLSAVALALAGAAHAQSAATGGQQAAAAEDTAGPAEIIVTATKRAENVQDIPISLSAVNADTLARQNISNLSRLDVLVPGFKFGQSGNDARPAIRGTRTQQVIGNADPLVAFYSDGIYRSRPGQAVAPFTDVERVEVALGPQGTLFGRNSFGGAVNVISRAPRLGETDFGGTVQATNYAGLRGEAFANIALGEGAALRVSGYSTRRDGWVRNTGNPGNDLHDENDQLIRGQLKLETGAFSNLTRVEYWHGGGVGPGDFGYFTPGVPINPTTRRTNGVNGVIDPVIAPVAGRGGGYGGLLPGTLSDADWRTISRNLAFQRQVRQTTVSNESNLDLGVADARLILSYTNYREFRLGDPDYSNQVRDAAYNQVTAKTWTQELQIVSKPNQPLSWVVGAFLLQDTPTDLYAFGDDLTGRTNPRTGRAFDVPVSFVSADNRPFNIYIQGPFTSKTNSVALYGDATFRLTDSFRVLGGIRWTRDKRTATIDNVPFAASTDYGSPNRSEGPQERTYRKVTWRAGAQLDVAERSMLYATYSTGFLAGGFSGAPSFAVGVSSLTTFDPQTATAIEVGSKNSFLDGRMRFNLSAYRNVYDNLIAQRLTQVGNAISTTTANAGTIRSWGVGAELDFYPDEATYLGLRVAYTHARFGDYVVGNNFTEGANVAGANSFQLDGLQVPLNPDLSITATGQYDVDAGAAGVFSPGATVFYSTSYRTSDQPYFFANQGGYATVDAFLRWRPDGDSRINAQLFVNNATDKRILLRTTPNAGSVIYQDFANPRIFGVRLGYNF